MKHRIRAAGKFRLLPHVDKGCASWRIFSLVQQLVTVAPPLGDKVVHGVGACCSSPHQHLLHPISEEREHEAYPNPR